MAFSGEEEGQVSGGRLSLEASGGRNLPACCRGCRGAERSVDSTVLQGSRLISGFSPLVALLLDGAERVCPGKWGWG